MDAVLVVVSLFAGQVDQDREAGLSLDERPDGGAFQPDEQVAFPVPGHGAVIGRRGAFADHDVGTDVSPRLVSSPGAGDA